MMTHKELKMKALADPETMAEYEAQKPEFELLDKLLEATKRAGSRRSINMTTKGQYGTSEMARDFGGLTFGNALSSYRIGEEKSQREFAGFLGISPQSLCDIEKERRIPMQEPKPFTCCALEEKRDSLKIFSTAGNK